jgi:hypothetical protein
MTLLLLAGCAFCGRGESIPGDASRFDPIAFIATARADIDGTVGLERFDASGVRSDGTVDLEAESYESSVTYRFVRAVPPPEDQPPIGAGGSSETVWHRETRVVIENPGYHETHRSGTSSKGYLSEGYSSYEVDPEPGAPEIAPDPTCSLATLWQAAIASGAPESAVANVRYDASGYWFDIDDTDVRLRFGMDCAAR